MVDVRSWSHSINMFNIFLMQSALSLYSTPYNFFSLGYPEGEMYPLKSMWGTCKMNGQSGKPICGK